MSAVLKRKRLMIIAAVKNRLGNEQNFFSAERTSVALRSVNDVQTFEPGHSPKVPYTV
jgi:hypothetical protein